MHGTLLKRLQLSKYLQDKNTQTQKTFNIKQVIALQTLQTTLFYKQMQIPICLQSQDYISTDHLNKQNIAASDFYLYMTNSTLSHATLIP